MKKAFNLLTVLVTLFAITPAAFAEVRGGAFTVSPFVGGYTFDGIEHLKTNVASGLKLGYNVNRNWGAEASFTYVPLRSTIPSPKFPLHGEKGDMYGFRGDILYHFMPEKKFVPFVMLGGGWSWTKNYYQDNSDATLDYGVGAKYFINDWIALRGDVNQIWSFHTSKGGASDYWLNLQYTAGVSFQFGGARKAISAVAVEKPAEIKPAPTPAAGPTEVVLPGRLPGPPGPAPAPVTEPAPVPAVPVSEGPTSWVAEKTNVPEGKILVTGLKVVQNALEIIATEPIRDYKLFTLTEPSRLVIDIYNGLNGFRTNSFSINKLGIATVRFGDHPGYLRITLDSAQGNLLPYRIEETDKGLKLIVTTP